MIYIKEVYHDKILSQYCHYCYYKCYPVILIAAVYYTQPQKSVPHEVPPPAFSTPQ